MEVTGHSPGCFTQQETALSAQWIGGGLVGYQEVCHPRCVYENWEGHVVKHNYVN